MRGWFLRLCRPPCGKARPYRTYTPIPFFFFRGCAARLTVRRSPSRGSSPPQYPSGSAASRLLGGSWPKSLWDGNDESPPG
jgi:hypothetical protein